MYRQGTVLMSRELIREGARIGYLCREEPQGEDSGWRFYTGQEDALFFMEPDHMVSAELSDVIAAHPELEPLMDSPAGAEYRRDGEGGFVPAEPAEEKAGQLLIKALAGSSYREHGLLRIIAVLAILAALFLTVRHFFF